MADSVSQISKSNDKGKFNSVNRTTSETLRVADGDRGVVQPSSLNVGVNPKKKTSFQITSITIGSRMSNDGGDDSADDLDESHTDDVSEVNDASRATDVERETPSYSEDTFSKDDVFFNASASLASAPVIPTSSQYGLAILDSNEGEVSADPGASLAESDLALVTEKVINLVSSKHDPEVKDSPHTHTTRSERFKVVKIESTEPFKRGRWVCMDYLDHTTQAKADEPASQPATIVPLPKEEHEPEPPPAVPYTSSPGQSLQGAPPPHPHGQSLSHPVDRPPPNHTSLQPQQMQQVLAAANHHHMQPPPQQMQQLQQQQFQQQQHQFQAIQQQQSQLLLQQQMAAQMHLGMPHVPLQPLPYQPPAQQYPPFQPILPQQQYYPMQPLQPFPSQPLLPQVPAPYTHVPTPAAPPPVQSLPAPLPPSYASVASSAPTYPPSVVSSVPSTHMDTTTPSSDLSEPATPAAALLESLAGVNTEEPPPGEDAESASGASAVAIDNKIEQAMDLVKSHLMFAVREEVEVLKEKISELMERINHLETENTVLRQHATQETLAQLPQALPPPPQPQPQPPPTQQQPPQPTPQPANAST